MRCAGQIGLFVCQYDTANSGLIRRLRLHNTAQQTRQRPSAEYMADAGDGQTTPRTKGEANERDCVHCRLPAATRRVGSARGARHPHRPVGSPGAAGDRDRGLVNTTALLASRKVDCRSAQPPVLATVMAVSRSHDARSQPLSNPRPSRRPACRRAESPILRGGRSLFRVPSGARRRSRTAPRPRRAIPRCSCHRRETGSR